MFSNDGEVSQSNGETSVYQRALGMEFATLDPQLRTYFGVVPAGFVGVGSGRYRTAGLGVRALRPLFVLLGWRNIAFAEHGEDVPFTVRNTYRADGTLTATRAFEFGSRTQTMCDRMQMVGGRLVDRIGTNGELDVELAVKVVGGALFMRSERIALRLFGLRMPLPRIVRVDLLEEACPDGSQSVDVRLLIPLLGEVYGYSGTFTYEVRPDT